MEVFDTIEALRAHRRALRGRVAFVPTMGYLHEGHMALVREGLKHADHAAVSIFVNPTQFGPDEDLAVYPRDLDGDLAKCDAEGVEMVFVPTPALIYPEGYATRVHVERLGEVLCGPSRPVHFDGVTTVVCKLFQIVRPDVAVFGQKDYQQLQIVRRMVRDLHLGVEVVGLPTVREADGLAMSSRNRYLEGAARGHAKRLSQALLAAHAAFGAGERDAGRLVALASSYLEGLEGVAIDYVDVVDPDDLERLSERAEPLERAVMALSAYVGQARLIDNLRLDAPLPDALASVVLEDA